MNERGLFGLPTPGDYTGKYRRGDFVKFFEVGYELFGQVIDIYPQAYRPYCIHVRPNMQLLISGIYWEQEGDLTPVSPEEMPKPFPADEGA